MAHKDATVLTSQTEMKHLNIPPDICVPVDLSQTEVPCFSCPTVSEQHACDFPTQTSWQSPSDQSAASAEKIILTLLNR